MATVRGVVSIGNGLSFSNLKLSRFTKTGFWPNVSILAGPDVNLNANQTDPRLTAFETANGAPAVLMTNRGGPPGQPGVGENYELDPSTTLNLNTEIPLFNSVIANPYATVVVGGILYILDYDAAAIYGADLNGYDPNDPDSQRYPLINNGQPLFQFAENVVPAGVDMTYKESALFALFTSASSTMPTGEPGGDYDPSSLFRFTILSDGLLSEPGPNDRLSVGRNAMKLEYLQYTAPEEERRAPGFADGGYFLIPCAGGPQNNGYGNDSFSVLSVVDIGGYTVKNPALYGTFLYTGETPSDPE